MGNLHEDQYIFFISSRLILLRMRKSEVISFG